MVRAWVLVAGADGSTPALRASFAEPGLEQPAEYTECCDRAGELGENERRDAARLDAREGIAERSRDGDCRVGERRGRREPVGRRDIESNGVCTGRRSRSQPEDRP